MTLHKHFRGRPYISICPGPFLEPSSISSVFSSAPSVFQDFWFCFIFPTELTLSRFAEGDLHQMGRHIVELRLQVMIVTGKFLAEGLQVHEILHLVQ